MSHLMSQLARAARWISVDIRGFRWCNTAQHEWPLTKAKVQGFCGLWSQMADALEKYQLYYSV
jgi:hypothetical protein